jgi:membrane protease YdiL (CAAX protease family)
VPTDLPGSPIASRIRAYLRRFDFHVDGRAILRILRRSCEVTLVILIAFGQGFYLSLIAFFHPAEAILRPGMYLRWDLAFFRDLYSFIPPAYFLSRRGLRFKDIGLEWSWRDVMVSAPLTLASYAAFECSFRAIDAIRWHIFASRSHDLSGLQVFGHSTLAALPVFLLNPFVEELIVRAYLMTEVQALTNSWIPAIILSTVIQASYHLYYGWQTALAMGFQFLVLSIYFAKTRRAAPIILVHMVFDIYPYIQQW